MVRGYFYEIACVIQECHRTLEKNSYMFMVNDNVRYAGVAISVDMILSRIAEKLGFEVENILILPQRKGNSSQQMGRHGREALRKCVSDRCDPASNGSDYQHLWPGPTSWRKST